MRCGWWLGNVSADVPGSYAVAAGAQSCPWVYPGRQIVNERVPGRGALVLGSGRVQPQQQHTTLKDTKPSTANPTARADCSRELLHGNREPMNVRRVERTQPAPQEAFRLPSYERLGMTGE